MSAGFRRSFAACRRALATALSEGAEGSQVAGDLWALSRLMESSSGLRRAVADVSREADDKAGLVARVVGGKVGEGALQVTEAVARQRWPSDGDIPRALEYLAVEALLVHAQQEGRLGQVEDELFRFSRIVAGSDDLRAALVDRRADPQSRGQLVDQLLESKTTPETLRLVRQAVTSPRARRFDQAIEGYLSVAAVMQQQFTATVISAVPLPETQLRRLTDALGAQYGRPVHANVVVDPQVIGGIRVEIGDEVIDGTISSRLDDARRALTS